MRIATAVSRLADPEAAIAAAWAALVEGLGGARPDLVLASVTQAHGRDAIADALDDRADGAPWAAGTSCQGVMTEAGVVRGGPVVALWGLSDPRGLYGVGVRPLANDPRVAARRALDAALSDAGAPGELPHLVWLVGAPGHEEPVLSGIADAVGPQVPVVGGSTADDAVAGAWWQAAPGWSGSDGVVVVVMMPSVPVRSHYQMGYAPTAHRARVTAASGRTLITLDDEPAAAVYDRWTRGALAERGRDTVLQATTLHPLGRAVASVGGVTSYLLAHPADVAADGSLRLFATVEPGEELTLMAGTRASLLRRAGRVAARARDGLPGGATSGALVIYCAGCMLAVDREMDRVAEGLRSALGGAPFVGAFTFGEQGRVGSSGNRHGNLMISVVTFGTQDQT